MDHRNRAGYHPGDRRHVALLNLAILGVCAAMYGITVLARSGEHLTPALRFHLTDFIAAPALLAFANMLTIRSPFLNAFARPKIALLVIAFAAAEWELTAALYTESTRDPWDVLAYFLGTVTYLLIAGQPPNTALHQTAAGAIVRGRG